MEPVQEVDIKRANPKLKRMLAPEKRYGHLLADQDVRRWYENIGRGSEVTADIYLRRLGNFCKTRGLEPKRLMSLNDKQLHDLLMDFVSEEDRKGHAGSYVGSVFKAIRSWLAYNGRELKWKIKIRGLSTTPTLKEERIPTKDELKRIFYAGDKKARVASVLVAQSGLRIESLGNYKGNEGLRVKDIPELKLENGKVEFNRIPAIIVVRQELSKAGHRYFTFLGEEGCGFIKEYLEERMKEGEKLDFGSPLITPKRKLRLFIRSTNISDAIRKAVRKAGFRWRPYVLRCYFATKLMQAEKSGMLRDYRTFLMGHKGDIENRYTTNKGRLPADVIEDIREAYREAQSLLETTVTEVPTEEKQREQTIRTIFMTFGYKPEEIDRMDISSMNVEELHAKLAEKMLGKVANNGATQKVIPLEEIEKYLSQGWEFVATLGNGKAVIKLLKV